MRKIIFFILVVLLVSCASHKHDNRYPGRGFKSLGDGYKTKNNEIYYNKPRPPYSSLITIPEKSEADFKTFINLGNRYAIDKYNAFYQGVIIPEADLNSFSVISIENEFPNLPKKEIEPPKISNVSQIDAVKVTTANFHHYVSLELEYYSKDKFNVFYGENVIPSADPNTFQLLSLFFAKDNDNVYFLGQPIEDSDPTTFELIAGRLAGDKNQIYYNNEVISTDPDNFVIFDSYYYAKDNESVWFIRSLTHFSIEKLDVVSPEMFKIIDSRYASDSKKVFCHGKLIPDVDVESFQILGDRWSKDSKHIYFGVKICNEVDYDTFEITEDGAKDKNRSYGKDFRPRF